MKMFYKERNKFYVPWEEEKKKETNFAYKWSITLKICMERNIENFKMIGCHSRE